MRPVAHQPPRKPTACDKCQGTGELTQPKPGTKGWGDMVVLPCPKCRGNGASVAKVDQVPFH